MARMTMDGWIPEEFGSEVLTRVQQNSAVELLAHKVPMKTDTKSVPRSGAVSVDVIPKGGAYGEDQSVNDAITLKARKFGKAMRIAEEDIDDSLADIVGTKQTDWATSYAKGLDNACLAVTGAENGTTVPFTSVYYAVRHNDASTGYVADTNYSATGGPATYDQMSDFLASLEEGDYFDPNKIVLIAHTAFRSAFRGVKDDNGRPVWVQALAGTPESLFGQKVVWSNGAKTSALYSSAPTGNPLLIAVNSDYLQLGIRSGPESIFIDGRNGLAALTDESILKMRARRGFALGSPFAAAVLEVTPATP